VPKAPIMEEVVVTTDNDVVVAVEEVTTEP
jgi:hypothetical protein